MRRPDGVAVEIGPADVVEDVRQVIGPHRPDANVCWCLSYRIPSKLGVSGRHPEVVDGFPRVLMRLSLAR